LAATGVVDPVDDHQEVAVGGGEVTYHVCPDQAAAGSFHRGDRVYATGRNEAGDWVAVRAPLDVNVRVWVRAEGVDPDRSFDDLPVVGCEPLGGGATEQAGSSTTTAPAESTTSSETTSTETTQVTTTVPESTESTETVSPTVTGPSDTAGPVIGAVTSDQPKIWESGCAVVTANIRVPVSDAGSGVVRVQLGWSVAGLFGATDMTQSLELWLARIGPFTDVLSTYEEPISMSVTAWDRAGNISYRDAGPVLVLGDCD
jgi:hypothetical protein